MNKIQMVDLKGQYQNIKLDIDQAIQNVIDQTAFINGEAVAVFNNALSQYHNGTKALSCGNGTDALQIALMSLNLKPGDEVITPAFTYFATVEVILLLGLRPVFVDVDAATFNIDVTQIENVITAKTKAIVPVHLFGQCANMEHIMQIAQRHQLYVVEDNAQAIGASITFSNGSQHQSGTIGHIGCTSFFPSKNLGCYGDGGALTTKDETLYQRIKSIANHGQGQKYHHSIVGVNSRLDTIQAAILNVKLPLLDQYNKARQAVATQYNKGFETNNKLCIPFVSANSLHVYHQYTLKLDISIDRSQLKSDLAAAGIPSMIYYPLPCHQQQALLLHYPNQQSFPIAEQLAASVLSLPIHTEMSAEQVDYIIEKVNALTE